MRKTLAALTMTLTAGQAAGANFDLAAPDIIAPWPEPFSLALGAGMALAVSLPLIGWQRWRRGKMERRAAAAAFDARAFAQALAAAPDGFYAWRHGRSMGGECSRRLAVLLSLPRGTESDWDDVLAAIGGEDATRLRQAVQTLRAEGTGFGLDLSLAEGGRRVRATGIRAVDDDGTPLVDVVWLRDVTEGAIAVEDLTRSLQALAADTAHLGELLDVLPFPVWLRGDDLSLLYVNRPYARAVEAASPGTAVAEQVELAPDGLVREVRALAARARAAGEARGDSFHLVLGGQRRLTRIVEVPLEVGGRLLTAGFATDETALEDARDALERHVTAHAEVLERLSTAIAIFSTDTRLAFHNTAFARLWRLEAEWLGTAPTYGQILDALRERRQLPEVADYRAFKEEEIKRFISLIDAAETLLHLPDGRTLRRLISPHPHGGMIFTYEDVTDTLALERSFNTMMAVQKETLDHLHEGAAVFGGDGRLKLCNPAFARIWALEPEDLAGEPHISEIVERHRRFFEGRPDRASDWPAARALLLGLLGSRTPREGRLERQDGSILDFASVPLPDGAMLTAWLDVTDTARVERALRERNEALAAADTLKSEFIANVSAEVRKPLTTIIGFSEMLEAEYFGKLSRRQHEYTRGIIEAGQALQTLISDILDLAAIEAGQMTLELDTVDVHPMVGHVLSLLRERVREKKLTLTFDCPLDIGWIVADTRRLQQVLFNLVGNAVKFTPQGGTITVSTQRRDGEIVFTVSDTGPGMPETLQAKVFESFRHGANEAGAGLGLVVVRRFVELHGGRIDLASTPGAGTTITVRLPTAAA